MIPALLALALAPEVVREWLVIEPLEIAGRRPFRPEEVFRRHLFDPASPPPEAGAILAGERGEEQAWAVRAADAEGSLAGRIGWAYAAVESAEDRVVLAKLTGASRLFVNRAGFAGDFYAYGFGGIPIALRKGRNDVYVTGVRGRFRLELTDAPAPVVAAPWDHTLPDLVPGIEAGVANGGALVWNATNAPLSIEWTTGSGGEAQGGRSIPALAPFKIGLELPALPPAFDPATEGGWSVPLRLRAGGGWIDAQFAVPIRTRTEARRVSFTSRIDGSAQWYAVLPCSDLQETPYIVLSLHGASVDALSQARAYSPKDRFQIVCPTNRRPYGFDWQDWGRLDAYEALDAERAAVLGTREQYGWMRAPGVHLTGHSMGGHGTWHLAANDPDTFLAIAPSAGWASFDSYGGRPEGELRDVWHAADAASRTLDLIGNLAAIPTFVLHGTQDDNVPVREAKTMVAALEEAGAKPAVHYQEGAGHWWDGDRAQGADCVDWPGIFDLFHETRVAHRARAFDWRSVDPGVDADHYWVQVLQPLRYGQPFRVTARPTQGARRIDVTTNNVRRIRIGIPPGYVPTTLDGRAIHDARPVTMELTDKGWQPAREETSPAKSPDASGPFKRAFGNRFVLVYGTRGDDAEDRELFERARHDLEVWWYRANGTPDLWSDTDFLAAETKGRNVILYGNADTNAAWEKTVPPWSPIVARRGSLKLGAREWKGDDLGAVFVLPRAGDAAALVGAFADTGARGSRLGYTLAPFVSGVGYPDYALFSSAILTHGDGGVLATGWFDHLWRLDPARFVRAEPR